MIVTEGTKRRVTREEVENFKTRYIWVITSPYTYRNDNNYIEVPKGFLTDGSTFTPDLGVSWIFHDYLYSTHKFTNDKTCTRVQADQVMLRILRGTKYDTRIEGLYVAMYTGTVSMISYYNPPNSFGSAWITSGERGPEFLENL